MTAAVQGVDTGSEKPRSVDTSRLMHYEDLLAAPVRRFGPLVFSTALLDQLLDMMGEKHPVHDSDEFSRVALGHQKRIVPGGFIHSITSGWAVQHGAAGAIVGLKSLTWDFVRPLYPDTPFYFTTEIEHAEEISDRLGLVKTVRRVSYESGETIAIGRMKVVMARRREPRRAA